MVLHKKYSHLTYIYLHASFVLCDGQLHMATRGDTGETQENKVYYNNRI